MITLEMGEFRLSEYMGKNKYAFQRGLEEMHGKRVEDEKLLINGGDPIKNDINAYGGELAYCRIHNIYPDMDYKHHRYYDCKLPNGKLVDVKTTPYPNGHLMVEVKEREGYPDLYALMIGVFPRYTYIGVVEASILIQDRFFVPKDSPKAKEMGWDADAWVMTKSQVLSLQKGKQVYTSETTKQVKE